MRTNLDIEPEENIVMVEHFLKPAKPGHLLQVENLSLIRLSMLLSWATLLLENKGV